MAGGKRYKFQDTTISFVTNYHADSPSDAITGVTKANPAVVTSAAHGRATGDVIRINAVVGMTELNGEVVIIERVDANSYKLLGVNSTDYTAYVSGGRVDVATFSQLCELTGFNRQGGSSPEIAATSICSDAQEFEIGLPDFGSAQVDYNFAPSTGVQQAIQAFYKGNGTDINAGDVMAAKIVLPKNGGTMVMLGFVQQTSETAQTNGIWTGSMTLRLTGQRQDFFA